MANHFRILVLCRFIGLCGLITLLCTGWSGAEEEDHCHPAIESDMPQYIIGYGSLMEEASKRRTAPNTGMNLPVHVSDYQRAWNMKGSTIGFSTTYLGVRPQNGAYMVAALYRVFNADDIYATDRREGSYCREQVGSSKLRMLDGTATPEAGQIWIYVNKPEHVARPTADFPIVQSYVDIFINGCMELKERTIHSTFDFAEACIRTTEGWSNYWVNDRLYPRRPFIYQSSAGRIDALLNKILPELFKKIRIE